MEIYAPEILYATQIVNRFSIHMVFVSQEQEYRERFETLISLT